MPTYEFRCTNGHVFDEFHKISDAPKTATCAVCGAEAARAISGGAGLVFKGSGFYLTDYGKNAHRGTAPPGGDSKGGDAKGGDGKSAESKGAEGKGAESKGQSKADGGAKSKDAGASGSGSGSGSSGGGNPSGGASSGGSSGSSGSAGGSTGGAAA